MKSSTKGLVATLLPLTLSSCLGSEKPLFPDARYPHLILQTPVKPGYYIKNRTSLSTGKKINQARSEMAIVTLKGTSYTLQASGGYEYSFPIGSGETNVAQIVGPSALMLQKNLSMKGQFLSQIKYKNIYTYRFTMVDKNSFSVVDQECGKIYGRVNMSATKNRDGACIFKDAMELYVIASADRFWANSDFDSYYYIESSRTKSFSELGAKLSPFCLNGDDSAPVILGVELGGENPPANPHWRVVSVTARAHATVESGFAVEADGAQAGGWGRISSWNEDERKLYCGGTIYMKIAAYMPESNQIRIVTDSEKIRKKCLDRAFIAGTCGTHEELIARFKRRGYRILAQGLDYRAFPDRKMISDKIMTIMGQVGEAQALIAISTEPDGMSNVIRSDE